ncbi:MAG: DUF4214 domain-containing protein [Acetobacteraceae bacterium]|nr:DUF4214 domain-containing protein [Acetobacteraceae bacterium]
MPSQASINAVATVFQNVFGRAPTSQESTAWASQLDSGATAVQLAAALAGSAEGAANVSALYQQILGRGLNSVSSSEIAAGQAYLAQDRANGLASLRASMADSAEAQADIKAIYQNVLGRAASSTEVTNAVTALTNGATLAQIVTSAEASPELAANLTRAYESALHTATPPTASVLTFLREQIVSGDTFSNLTAALDSQAGSAGGTTVSSSNTPSGTTASSPNTPSGTAVSTSTTTSGTTVTNSSGANGSSVNGTNGTSGADGASGASVPGANGTSVSETSQSTGTTPNQGAVLPASYNPAESMLSSTSGSAAAAVTTASSAAANGAGLVQLTNPATVGITPTLHGS